MAQAENELAEMAAVAEWLTAAVRGESVSEFAESYAAVREALDLRESIFERDGK